MRWRGECPRRGGLRLLGSRLRLGAVADWLPVQRAEHLAMLVDGLRKAGLPE